MLSMKYQEISNVILYISLARHLLCEEMKALLHQKYAFVLASNNIVCGWVEYVMKENCNVCEIIHKSDNLIEKNFISMFFVRVLPLWLLFFFFFCIFWDKIV